MWFVQKHAVQQQQQQQQQLPAAASCTPEQSGEQSCGICKQHCNPLFKPAPSCGPFKSLHCS
jgi:hypothetical protein